LLLLSVVLYGEQLLGQRGEQVIEETLTEEEAIGQLPEIKA
jgi:hypothetical protein